MLLSKDTQFRPYKEGERVWLDAQNLCTTHPTHKLRPKRYGPFAITKVLSHVAYQLGLPPTWKIHNVFHASYLSLFKETTEYGPNFLEPPPEMVDGEPEWEVEQIVGMRLFGPKKIKQYRIRWKGYPPAHDTWEPAKDVHAPKLIQQFLDGSNSERGMSIRTIRVKAEENSMHEPRESQREIPGLQPITTINTNAASPNTEADFANELAREFSRRIIEGTIQTLNNRPPNPTPRAAHHEVLQETKEEGSKEREDVTRPPLIQSPEQTEPTPNYHPQIQRLLGRVVSERRPIHCNRNPNPRLTEEAVVSEYLLKKPILNEIEDFGYPEFHMDLPTGLPPNPPWFKRPEIPFIPKLEAEDENGRTFELPYLRFALSNDEPVILGTTERDAPVYQGEIKAMPAPHAPYNLHVDDDDLEDLYLDHPFNWAVNYALYRLGDAGVLADVHRLRMSYAKLKHFKEEHRRMRRIIDTVQKEVHDHNTKIQTFIKEVEGFKSRLVQAKVCSQIAPMLVRLQIEGMAPDPIYPYGSFDATQPPPPAEIIITEEPVIRRPATPYYPTIQPISTSSESGYIPSTPSPLPTGPPPGQGIPVARYTNALGPRILDYTAGNDAGPSHCPLLFDTEPLQQWVLPHIPSTAPPTENPPFLGFAPPQCFFCRDVRHAASDCGEPHQKCKKARRCVVPLQHPSFDRLCQYGTGHHKWGSRPGPAPRTTFEEPTDPQLPDGSDNIEEEGPYEGGCEWTNRSPSPVLVDTPDSALFDPRTPSTSQPTHYWDNFELQTINLEPPAVIPDDMRFTAPTNLATAAPTPIDFSDPAWPDHEPNPEPLDPAWTRRNSPFCFPGDPSVSIEWGGSGELLADSMGADSYEGGNVTYPPTPARSTRQ